MKKILISIIALLLAACSSQSTKLTKAINVSLQHPSVACELIPLNYSSGFIGFSKNDHQLMTRLTELGFFKKTEKIQKFFNSTITEYNYEPTEKVTPYLSHSFVGHSICFATGKVVKLVNYTEPTSVLGVTGSQVQYTYTLTGNSLSEDKEIARILGEKLNKIAESKKEPLQDSEWLVLTKNGWEQGNKYSIF